MTNTSAVAEAGPAQAVSPRGRFFTSSGLKGPELPVGNLPVWITHIPDGAVLRNDDNHAFWVLTAEPVRGSMPRASLIRTLFDKLRSFKI